MSSFHTARHLHEFASAVEVLATALPARTTVRQALALSAIAAAHASKRVITLGDLLSDLGSEALGPSIERTIGTFFPPSRHYPDALGWVEQRLDPDDRRRKVLVLTDEGVRIFDRIGEALQRD